MRAITDSHLNEKKADYLAHWILNLFQPTEFEANLLHRILISKSGDQIKFEP